MKEEMKKDYNAPKAEKLEFDYNQTVVASNGGNGKMPCIIGMGATYTDGNGNTYSTSAPGNE